MKTWIGKRDRCEVCQIDISTAKFADARVPSLGCWALLCLACFNKLGCVLGTGRGQMFAEDGRKING